MKRARAAGLILAVLSFIVISGLAQSGTKIPGIASTTGAVSLVELGGSLADGGLESDQFAFVFLEREEQTLEEVLRVDLRGTGKFVTQDSISAGTVSTGTVVNSYFFHRDPTDRLGTLPGVGGSVTFEQNILGVILTTSSLRSTNVRFSAERTNYSDPNGLEFSNQASRTLDELEILSNSRTLRFFFQNNSEIDQIRVITRATGDQGGSSDNNSGGGSNSNNASNRPDVENDESSTTSGRSILINVLDNDSDSDNNLDRETLTITDEPENGSASVNESEGTITYRPNSGFVGTDSFEYEICDATDRCGSATVTITVSQRSSGGDDDSSRVTLRTLLPEAEICSFSGEASLDIVPGNDDNLIRLDDGEGFTPVAILSSELFPAANCVDVGTIRFGVPGNEQTPLSCGAVSVREEEFVDIVCDFKTSELNFRLGDTSGTLTAQSITGDQVVVSDRVEVVEPRRHPGRIISSVNDKFELRQLHIGTSVLITSHTQAVQSIELKLFSISGRLLQSKGSKSGVLRFTMSAHNGRPLANGVYIAVVKLIDSEGHVVGHSLSRLVQIR